MPRSLRRILLALSLSAALVVGVAIGPAAALSGQEQRTLNALKRQYNAMTRAVKSATCEPYALTGPAWIGLAVDAAMTNSASSRAMSRASWTRVLTAYYRWACPGGSPRAA
jgi:hypothetical protein